MTIKCKLKKPLGQKVRAVEGESCCGAEGGYVQQGRSKPLQPGLARDRGCFSRGAERNLRHLGRMQQTGFGVVKLVGFGLMGLIDPPWSMPAL